MTRRRHFQLSLAPPYDNFKHLAPHDDSAEPPPPWENNVEHRSSPYNNVKKSSSNNKEYDKLDELDNDIFNESG
jgi:hypothetical protein